MLPEAVLDAVREQFAHDALHIRLIRQNHAVKLTLDASAFTPSQVTFRSNWLHKFSGTVYFETFLRRLMGLHLRHCYLHLHLAPLVGWDVAYCFGSFDPHVSTI